MANDKRAFRPEGLPFDDRQAKAVLAEMLALGTAFGNGGDLKLMAGQGWLEREEARKRDLRAENDALADFAETGEVATGNAWTRAAASGTLPETSQAEQFKNAQKALLLAWEHEECVLSICELEAKVLGGQSRLKAALGEAAGDNSEQCAEESGLTRPEYSWRILLDAMSAFLPEDAMLLTAHAPMIDDMRALGILEPLPGDVQEELVAWPEALASSLLTTRLPLWRVLGYASLPQDRPWLGATYQILAATRLEK